MRRGWRCDGRGQTALLVLLFGLVGCGGDDTDATDPDPEATDAMDATGGSGEGDSGDPDEPVGVDPDCDPDPACTLSAPPTTGDSRQDCVDRINQFREECLCLPPLARWTEGEDCADEQAEYDVEDGPHAGFSDRICEPRGSAQNECPGWGSTEQVIGGCLQMMWDEGPPDEQPCRGDCFQAHGHFINMSSESSTKVACGFFETPSGEVWAVQNFSR